LPAALHHLFSDPTEYFVNYLYVVILTVIAIVMTADIGIIILMIIIIIINNVWLATTLALSLTPYTRMHLPCPLPLLDLRATILAIIASEKILSIPSLSLLPMSLVLSLLPLILPSLIVIIVTMDKMQTSTPLSSLTAFTYSQQLHKPTLHSSI
jgi:hypothetical protein